MGIKPGRFGKLLGVVMLSFIIVLSGCVNNGKGVPSKDKHLIEAKMNVFPNYLTPESSVSVKLELKNTGYGNIYIPYAREDKRQYTSIQGPCYVESLDIFPPPQDGQEIELKENQNKLFTWIIHGSDEVVDGKDKCKVYVKIPYKGKVTYTKYIPVINGKELLNDNSLYNKFKGQVVKDEHSNLDVSINIADTEPIIIDKDKDYKEITFRIIMKNKGDATAYITYNPNGKKDISISIDENIQLGKCEVTTNKEGKIEIEPKKQAIIECNAKVLKPSIASKYRIQVDIIYHYKFVRSINIPVYTQNNLPKTVLSKTGKFSLGPILNVQTSTSKKPSVLNMLFERTINAIAPQIVSGVVSDVLGISSSEMSDSLQTYMRMTLGTSNGARKADEKIISDGEYLSKKIFIEGKLESKEGVCRGEDVYRILNRVIPDGPQFANPCSEENIKKALIEKGCDKVIISNGDEYWGKEIDKAFNERREEMIQRIREGIKQGILSNGNVITNAYRDKIIKDLKIKMGKVQVNVDLNRIVSVIIEEKLISGLADRLTGSPTERAYDNYHAGFKSSFMEEYNTWIVDEVAKYSSQLCNSRAGIFGSENQKITINRGR